MWASASHSTSVAAGAFSRRQIWLPMVPLGTYTAASRSNSAATSASRALTDGSSPYTSSPTSASAIARRMPAVGRVSVSERRSTAPSSCATSVPQHLGDQEGQFQRLLGVEARVAGGLVPPLQVGGLDALPAAGALGDVAAGPVDAHAAGVGALGAVRLEEALHLVDDLVEVAGDCPHQPLLP